MRLILFAMALMLMLAPAVPRATDGAPPEVSYTKDKLAIITHEGRIPLDVEVAKTNAQIEHGLMFRSHLDENSGMIFLFPHERKIDFWMKNTLIPLDMLFINAQGRIIHLVENATPRSTAHIPSGGKVLAVLELAGGSVARLHIAKGDKVVYRHFHD